MRRKPFFRNSASTPKVTVRSSLSWPVRLVLAFLFVTVAAAAGISIYEYGRSFGGPDRQELTAEIEPSHLVVAVAKQGRQKGERARCQRNGTGGGLE